MDTDKQLSMHYRAIIRMHPPNRPKHQHKKKRKKKKKKKGPLKTHEEKARSLARLVSTSLLSSDRTITHCPIQKFMCGRSGPQVTNARVRSLARA